MPSFSQFASQNMRTLSVALAMLLSPLPAFALSRQEVCENVQNNFAPTLVESACTEMLKIKMPPKARAIAYHNRGLAKVEMNRIGEAIQDYNTALENNPESDKTYASRGFAKDKLGDPKGAVLDLDLSIKLNAYNAFAYRSRGSAKSELKDYQSAIDDFDQAIKLNPNDAAAYNSRGNARAALKDFEKAVSDYSRAIILGPGIATFYYNLGNAKLGLENYKEAIAAYDDAIRLNPNYSSAYNGRGYTRFKMRGFPEAIADFDRAIASKSDNTDALINRGLAKIELQDPEGARKDYQAAMAFNPTVDEDTTKLRNLLAEYDAKGAKPVAPVGASTPAAVAPIVAAIPSAAVAPAVAVVPPAGPLKGHYALVIGDDKYLNFPVEQQLENAYSDASAIGAALKDIGYQVMRGQNLTRQGMIDKLSAFTSQLHDGDTALFFFAGHGVSIEGANYLVPTDMPRVSVDSKGVVTGNSIKESDVVDQIQDRKVRIAVLILDACRDNPFSVAGTRAVLGNSRGLADAKPARGVFEIYSAGIGQSALDNLGPGDKNPNSVFTRVLVQTMRKNPDLDLPSLAVTVREQVAELAMSVDHEQTPAYYDQLIGGRVSLRTLVSPPVRPTTAPAAASGAAVPDATLH